MNTLYDQSALRCSQEITHLYSTSFTLGIKTLHAKYRPAIYAIYGFVRYADEIVDTFHDHDKTALLESFERDTIKAINEGISLNPVLHSLQLVVNQYKIDRHLVDAFIQSMRLDLHKSEYNEKQYKEYIYGSAEAVGLMCLKVFCGSDEPKYRSLEAPAKHLGAAFQKVNFLRDIKSDYTDRGRVYFPGIDFSRFNNESKAKIEEDIKRDFQLAYEGIKLLPAGARMGVYLAYIYYLKLFRKITMLPASRVATERVRIPDPVKILLLIKSYFRHGLNVI